MLNHKINIFRLLAKHNEDSSSVRDTYEIYTDYCEIRARRTPHQRF